MPRPRRIRSMCLLDGACRLSGVVNARPAATPDTEALTMEGSRQRPTSPWKHSTDAAILSGLRPSASLPIAVIAAGDIEGRQPVFAAPGPDLIGRLHLVRRIEGTQRDLDFIR
jgi:hypothetical protein